MVEEPSSLPNRRVTVMTRHGFLGTMLLAGSLLCGAAGCSSSEGAVADGADQALSSPTTTRQAQLNGLRGRVGQDFANVASLRDYKLVFVVHSLEGRAGKVAIRARIQKRDAAGNDFELTDEDFEGSAFERLIDEGVFDGPEVTAILVKQSDGSWAIARNPKSPVPEDEPSEAYVVGPTDIAYYDWPQLFDVPPEWLGFFEE
jgi:hypothetical protein